MERGRVVCVKARERECRPPPALTAGGNWVSDSQAVCGWRSPVEPAEPAVAIYGTTDVRFTDVRFADVRFDDSRYLQARVPVDGGEVEGEGATRLLERHHRVGVSRQNLHGEGSEHVRDGAL